MKQNLGTLIEDVSTPAIGLLHPGAMGQTIGRALAAGGASVWWCSAGRGPATARRAETEAFLDADDLSALVDAVEGIVSVCPPVAALTVARQVAATGFSGWYLDANAVSPDTVASIAGVLGNASVVDGGIVGPPADEPGTTRLYLSGPDADAVAARFASGAVEPIVLSDRIGDASAMKMLYAAYTKGSSALLLAIRGAAETLGLSEALLAEWDRSIPGLATRSDGLLGRIGAKAWRFQHEMEEIAETMASTGLPDGFHHAAATIYARLAVLKDQPVGDAAATLRRLAGPSFRDD